MRMILFSLCLSALLIGGCSQQQLQTANNVLRAIQDPNQVLAITKANQQAVDTMVALIEESNNKKDPVVISQLSAELLTYYGVIDNNDTLITEVAIRAADIYNNRHAITGQATDVAVETTLGVLGSYGGWISGAGALGWIAYNSRKKKVKRG